MCEGTFCVSRLKRAAHKMSEMPFGQKSDDNRSVGSKERAKMRKVGFLIGRQEGRKHSSNLDQCDRQTYGLQPAEIIKTEA